MGAVGVVVAFVLSGAVACRLPADLQLGAIPSGAGAASGPALLPSGEWAVETPESHGMDPVVLDQARSYVMADGTNTQALLIVHQGAIVAEWYAPGANRTTPGTSWSVGKSFTSAVVGIAIGEGLIPSVDEPMTTYYPEWIGTPKEAITLRHVLHMESGLDFVEDGGGILPGPDIIEMVTSHPDQLAFASSRPLEVPPGTRFQYSSGDSMLLSGVIEQATGMSVGEYARVKLFDRIGMGDVDWWQDAAGHSLTYCCIDTTARDFARFGQLYLDGGQWGSEQVVPASWVTDSLTDTAATNPGYGYHWWLDPAVDGVPSRFVAIGFDGQLIVVVPSLDLVVVRLGTYFKSPCPAIADPNLFTYIPPLGLVEGKGTLPPESLDTLTVNDFMKFVVDSFGNGNGNGNNSAGTDAAEAALPVVAQETLDAQSAVATVETCPNLAGAGAPTTTTVSAPLQPTAAATVTPAFTG